MVSQEEFNQHVQRIIDLKGKAIDLKSVTGGGLTDEEKAELNYLEETLPDIPKDEKELLEELFKKHRNKIKLTIEIEIDPEDICLRIKGA